jgi:hypothetical protein
MPLSHLCQEGFAAGTLCATMPPPWVVHGDALRPYSLGVDLPAARRFVTAFVALLLLGAGSGPLWRSLLGPDRCGCSIGACAIDGAACPLGGASCPSRTGGPSIGSGCDCEHGGPEGSTRRDWATIAAPLRPTHLPPRSAVPAAAQPRELVASRLPETPPPRPC